MKLFIHGKVPKGTHAIVDDEDWQACQRLVWRLDGGYVIGFYRKIRIPLQNFVLGLLPGQVVDHINGKPLDCRKANLRECTAIENNYNRKGWSRSGFKGVTIRPNGTYTARVGYSHRIHNLGTFSTPEEAAKVYDKWATYFFHEFARLNFGGTND